MLGEKADFKEAQAVVEGASGAQRRDRSTIDFPYLSLEAAEEVARALYSRVGHGSCELDELAAEMRHSVSGAVRQKTAAARVFGVVEKDGRSAFVLSNIGRRIVEESSRPIGRVEAFLAVPLYEKIFEKYRGHNLPPAQALEREMESLGVASKQTDRARQAFERSAAYAGFFDDGKDRLIRPRAAQLPPSHTQQEGAGKKRGSADDYDPPDVDPIIQGLLAKLPKSGLVWPESQRELWLELLKGSFKLIYKDAETKTQEGASH